MTEKQGDATDAERAREIAAASSSVFPGFRFSPTDHELISYYLKKKLQGSHDSVNIITEVDFCRHEPWDLPAVSIIQSDNEWFFFSARGKKYPNGSQSRRATQSGYWKATGKERNVKSGAVTIGTKRTLVFHTGRAPKGERTEWIMHEYCMSETAQEALVVCRLRRNGDFRLNERASSDRNFSTGDNSTQVTTIKSCSKESTSSDAESESESHIHDSPHSQHKGCGENEDDCFADIMKDDIIKLDESASNSLAFHGVFSGDMPLLVRHKLSQETMSSHPLSGQGTAVRRIKLRHQKGKKQHKKDRDQQPRCVAKTPTVPRYLILVFLSLLMILFVVWRAPICLQVSKRQLKFWLHKVANYI